jgi:hypothetical protein
MYICIDMLMKKSKSKFLHASMKLPYLLIMKTLFTNPTATILTLGMHNEAVHMILKIVLKAGYGM